MNSPEPIYPGPYPQGDDLLWDPRVSRLYWLDRRRRRFHFADLGQPPQSQSLQHLPSALCLTLSPSILMLATSAGLVRYDLATLDTLVLLAYPEADGTRFSHGKVDPKGRFWVSTTSQSGTPEEGSLYRIAPDFSCETVLDGLTYPNGCAWSADQSTLYFIDSPDCAISAFDFDPSTGKLLRRRTAVRIRESWGQPTGMDIDAEDRLWVAHGQGGCVAGYDPASGRAMERVDLPVSNVTCCCFGGVSLDTLYISTGIAPSSSEDRTGAAEQHPLSGAIFAWKSGSCGRSSNYFCNF